MSDKQILHNIDLIINYIKYEDYDSFELELKINSLLNLFLRYQMNKHDNFDINDYINYYYNSNTLNYEELKAIYSQQKKQSYFQD